MKLGQLERRVICNQLGYVDICGTRSVRGEGHRYSGTGRVSWEVAELYETRSVREKGHM